MPIGAMPVRGGGGGGGVAGRDQVEGIRLSGSAAAAAIQSFMPSRHISVSGPMVDAAISMSNSAGSIGPFCSLPTA